MTGKERGRKWGCLIFRYDISLNNSGRNKENISQESQFSGRTQINLILRKQTVTNRFGYRNVAANWGRRNLGWRATKKAYTPL